MRLGLVIAASLTLLFGAQDARAQTYTLADAAEAVATSDLAALRYVASDQALLDQLQATDPESLIEFHLALAQAYADAGLEDEALEAYQAALVAISRIRGRGHLSMADPMIAVARLTDDPAVRANWFENAYRIRRNHLGRAHPTLSPYLEEVNAARAEAGLEPLSEEGERLRSEPNFDLVNVYWATHRAQTGSTAAAEMFGGQTDRLSFGVAEVSVPRDRAPGAIPRPSIWTLEFRPDPNRHMVLNSVTPYAGRDAFFQTVSTVVDATERREVFVFIHGYNTSFEGGAIRTAQLAVDMNLDGAPILYSWPSRASLLGYAADTDTAADEVMIQDVADFLTDVAGRTGAERVHLVAHSMGNRFLVRALDRIAGRADAVRFDEIVMAAPDVAVDEFQETWPRIMNTGERFTLYASQRDRALQISARINGMRRIGDAREVVVNEGLQTVDTTAASAGLLGHDDFAGSALADFRAVMWLSLAPDQRCVLETAEDDGRRYWSFGGECPEQDFGEVTQMVRANGSVEAALSRLETDMISVGVAARQELGRKRDLLRALFTQAASPAGAP